MSVTTLLDYFGVSVAALSGVLAARDRGLDLFGALVLALVTAVGGGSVRDVLTGHGPVFWLLQPGLFHAVCISAGIAFIATRHWSPSVTVFQIADALALCSFAIAGTRKGLVLGFGPSVSIALGVITGVAGGILRDALMGRVPLVFHKDTYFYATAAMFGGLAYVVLREPLGRDTAAWTALAASLLLRLGAIRYRLSLPSFSPPLTPTN